MKKVVHKAETRGRANYGWLDSHHTFSFGSYVNPDRMNFGMLRVLNDDVVAPGMGFGTHAHDNMEIISIPLRGELAHKDSTGEAHVIHTGDLQIMSAGSGITHSEYNASKTTEVNFLQIWILPKKRNINPRYEQITIPRIQNSLQLVVSPEKKEGAVWINQEARFYLGQFDGEQMITHAVHGENSGVYLFVIRGKVETAGEIIEARDGMGLWGVGSADLKALEDSEILLMEIPIQE